MREKDFKEVEDRAQRVISKTTDKKLLTDAYSLLSSVYKNQQRYDLSDKTYLKIIEIEPKSPWASINYSRFLISRGDYDKAIDYGKKALALMDFPMGHTVLGEAYYEKGVDLFWKKKQPNESKEYFALAIQHDPRNPNAYYGLGVSLYHVGHTGKNVAELVKAEEALTKAIKLKADHEEAKETLASVRQLLAKVRK